MKFYMLGATMVKVVGDQVFSLSSTDQWVLSDLNPDLVAGFGLPVRR